MFAQESQDFANALVVVISGFHSDPTPAQIRQEAPRGSGNSGMYQLLGDLKANAFQAKFFNWNGTAAGEFSHKDAPGADGITYYIRNAFKEHRFERLVLIGHSWGGHTMLEVARKLENEPKIIISLAIGVDPSSLSRGKRPAELPQTVKSCVIYHTQNAFVWGAWNGCDRVENVNLGNPANGFKSENGGDYSSVLDIKAHNAAEWDEGIHRDILRRVEKFKSIASEGLKDRPSVTTKASSNTCSSSTPITSTR